MQEDFQNLVLLDIEIERTLREQRRNGRLEQEDMERTRNENIHMLGVKEEMNAVGYRGQNLERERTLEEYWNLVI